MNNTLDSQNDTESLKRVPTQEMRYRCLHHSHGLEIIEHILSLVSGLVLASPECENPQPKILTGYNSLSYAFWSIEADCFSCF